MTVAGRPPPSHLSLEEKEEVAIIVHLMRMYGKVLSIASVRVLLAFKEDLVVKEISIGMGEGLTV